MSDSFRPVPDGRTACYAVLGHPVAHSLSPAMHSAAFSATGRNAVCLAFDVPTERFPGVIEAMGAMGFGGANLTIPLKEAAYRSLAVCDVSAVSAGSVNTVRFDPEGPVGYSTDGEGFLRAARAAFGEDPGGGSVCILGAGGAGRAVAAATAGAGAVSITIADLVPERAARVAAEIRTRHPGCRASAVPLERAAGAARDSAWVVQATPVGLRPGDPPALAPDAFHPAQRVVDLVYRRGETPTVRSAREAGAKAVSGLGMLLYQGALAFEIWTGRPAPVEAMRTALNRAAERSAAE